MQDLYEIEPKEVLKWFLELEKIPRESGNEKAVSDYLMSFAKDRGLDAFQDRENNVIIHKPGTVGYENSDAVIIQGHMDMVCEKSPDSKHDFLTDPIEVYVDGDLLRAKGTTLGGDDGVAVAIAMAVLDSKDIPHPPIEALLTTSEETGMGGAMAVTGEHLSGKTLLNIDSEAEGEFLVSCAGGGNVITSFDIERESFQGEALSIKISGYTGGHSGIEIIKQRGNAIKHLGRLLYALDREQGMNIVSISGGTKHNAIALKAEAVVAVFDSKKALSILKRVADELIGELQVSDPDAKIEIGSIDKSKEMFSGKLSSDLAKALFLLPHGVQERSLNIHGLVQTSVNIGILEEKEGSVQMTNCVRGSVRSSMHDLMDRIMLIAELCGGSSWIKNEYPAWQYELNSNVREKSLKVWKDLTGQDAKINAIHAGLECGLLKGVLPDCDMISYGPNLDAVHTFNESLSISSLGKIWEFTKMLLKELK